MSTRPMIRVSVPVCIEEDDHGYHGFCPILRGCNVGGDTIEETRAALIEAVDLYLDSMVKHGEPLPLGANIECGIPIRSISDKMSPAHAENLEVAIG